MRGLGTSWQDIIRIVSRSVVAPLLVLALHGCDARDANMSNDNLRELERLAANASVVKCPLDEKYRWNALDSRDVSALKQKLAVECDQRQYNESQTTLRFISDMMDLELEQSREQQTFFQEPSNFLPDRLQAFRDQQATEREQLLARYSNSDAQLKTKFGGKMNVYTLRANKRITDAIRLHQLAAEHIANLNQLGLPKCDDASMNRNLKAAVEDSPAGKTSGLALITTKNNGELNYEKWAGSLYFWPDKVKQNTRYCEADAYFNNGERRIVYTIKWIDASNLYISIEQAGYE